MKKILISLICLLLIAVMLMTSSCAMSVSALELTEGYSRKTTDPAYMCDGFIANMASFSFELFRDIITKDDENDLVSPLSLIICLAMVANGADNSTRTEIEQALGMTVEELNKSLYAYTSSLYSSNACKVSIADSIWFRNEADRLSVTPEFLQDCADWYDAEVYSAPFNASTVKDINKWCKDKTDGMIDKIIESIEEDTVMYLINALLFDAKWAEKYTNDQVHGHIFNNYDNTVSNIKMLDSKEQIYLTGDGAIGFAKNYEGNMYSFVGLLPDEGIDIYDYIASLDGESWLSIWNGRRHSSCDVMLPEFECETYMYLNEVLKNMGMSEMFDHEKADFSRLGRSEYGNIYCSSVEQKVKIEVDRNGTKAAAITWATNAMDGCAIEPLRIILDRPFVYAIVDNSTGLPLFIGAVTNIK